jgi:hypothetical protein
MHLSQRLGGVGALPPGTVEGEQDVVAIVIDLGSLTEVLGVLQRERVKAEQLTELEQLIVPGVAEIQPEEVIVGEVPADAGLVDPGQARTTN